MTAEHSSTHIIETSWHTTMPTDSRLRLCPNDSEDCSYKHACHQLQHSMSNLISFWQSGKKSGSWITSLMNDDSWRGQRSYLLYSTSGLSLQPKPSKSMAYTLCVFASSLMLYRQWYALAPNPWMSRRGVPLLPEYVHIAHQCKRA